MLIIHGPTYQYQGEQLAEPTIIYVQDHHYNEQEQCFHLEKLLSGTHNHTVVFDHVVQHDEFLTNPVYFPLLLARETCEFNEQNIITKWNEKTVAFNFIINKARLHRVWLIKLIDQLKLTNFLHSLCWQQSPVSSISITDYRLGNEIKMGQGVKNGNYPNALTYRELLKTCVFEPTAVSLITEPAYYERETIVTEKTIMAIYGGTVPIWVGGWRIPDYMQSQGFDIFNDVVDHSYQSLADPEQRCYRAIIDNIHLLHHPVEVDRARLQHNLDLVKSNPWLDQVSSLTKIYPDLRKVLPTWLL